MSTKLYELHGARILEVSSDGHALSERDAVDLIGDAIGQQADSVVLPASRLDDVFFDLSTQMAGEIAQKFVNYRRRLVVVGDIEQRLLGSQSLRDFVRECNRGRQIWFVRDIEALASRLQASTQHRVDPAIIAR
jgi:hypothetical protein